MSSKKIYGDFKSKPGRQAFNHITGRCDQYIFLQIESLALEEGAGEVFMHQSADCSTLIRQTGSTIA